MQNYGKKYPFGDATINQLDFNYDLATLQGVSGQVKLIPLTSDNNLYLNANISGDNGFNIKVIGDIFSRNLLLDAKGLITEVAELYSQPKVIELNPYLNGDIKAIITGENVLLQTLLGVKLDKPVPVNTLECLGNL